VLAGPKVRMASHGLRSAQRCTWHLAVELLNYNKLGSSGVWACRATQIFRLGIDAGYELCVYYSLHASHA